MELFERESFIASLENRFREISSGEGHCFFITGEAGIGKTSLVKEFLRQVEKVSVQYVGSCDLLFTPRPLAPLYDIASQIKEDLLEKISSIASRSELFLKFAQEIAQQSKPVIVVFEDVHWADEATLDFVKFFARRIDQVRCLFILTWRDDEVVGQHPLRNVLGHLVPGTYTRVQLTPLSIEAVQQMAARRGYNGEDVYSISGGNPFYVNEILANYSPGIPDNIKDSILAIYNDLSDETKDTWQFLSVIAEGLEYKRFTGINDYYVDTISNCMAKKILVIKNDKLLFKHELYRRAIEESLSPFKRIDLNKKVLSIFLNTFEENGEIERIVHYAKNASRNDLVVQYAPRAAKQAASVGAHIEASKLYLSAIEYYEGKDKDLLVQFYESYAYECYLTNQIQEAIFYQSRALTIRKEKDDPEMVGDCLRFLSRLWWFEGNRKQAERFAMQAIDVLDPRPTSRAKALAFTNLSFLKMQSDETDECVRWSEKAIALATELNDDEILAYALNSKGSTIMLNGQTMQEGMSFLQQSLSIALKNGYHEHVARAYTALGSNAVALKEYTLAKNNLNTGINYCEENDLDSLRFYMLSWKARMYLETGDWKEAWSISDSLVKSGNILSIIKVGALTTLSILKMRKGEPDILPLLTEAKEKAFDTMELHRILPVATAFLEYEWICGKRCIQDDEIGWTLGMIRQIHKDFSKSRFYYWLSKSREEYLPFGEKNKGNELGIAATSVKDAAVWKRTGCPYEEALALFSGNDEDKRRAISIVHELGADAVYEKLKQAMRSSGIKSIPRGVRKTTRENPSLLTDRELEVLTLLKEGMQNKEIAARLYISAKTVDHHISSILLKLDINSRTKAVAEAVRLGILK
jgi:DNA-binding CsgD family transcriptional regulator